MVAVAVSRVRTSSAPASASTARQRPSTGMWVIVGIPVLLAVTMVWQIAGGLFRIDATIHDAVAVSSVALTSDPLGSRIDLTLVDRAGEDTTVTGDLTVRLREPDGTVWQNTRRITPADFAPVGEGSLSAGRRGYSLVVPASDWVRAPRRGGQASISITVEPSGGLPISTTAEQRFP